MPNSKSCPICVEHEVPQDASEWVACDSCHRWFHTTCIQRHQPSTLSPEQLGGTINWSATDWLCARCHAGPSSDPLDMLATAAAGAPEPIDRPKRQAASQRPDYLAMHNHEETPTSRWLDLIRDPEKYGYKIREGGFPTIPGRFLNKEWVESTPLNMSPFYGDRREPILVRASEGFESAGGKLPPKSLNVEDIARLVGPDRNVDVIDVGTQSSAQWPLSKWAAYVKSRADPSVPTSSKVYNIISLEISGTELSRQVRPPTLVRELDWVDHCWRSRLKTKEEESILPKVQLYCLMGMKGAWTDWHVDFAASTVYYTIHTGSKEFFFIRPTEANLQAYAKWSGSQELQHTEWLGAKCDEVRRVVLHAGDTMIIPSGYIHAVYTPSDAIVFGGNFLHSYDIPTQLRLRQIEIDTKVPQRFRFPQFDKLCWYVAHQYVTELRQRRVFPPPKVKKQPLHPRILQGLVELSKFLISQIALIEDDKQDDKKRKIIHDRIPVDVGDASGLAVELGWRVAKELGSDMGANIVDRIMGVDDVKQEKVIPKKRGIKREGSLNGDAPRRRKTVSAEVKVEDASLASPAVSNSVPPSPAPALLSDHHPIITSVNPSPILNGA